MGHESVMGSRKEKKGLHGFSIGPPTMLPWFKNGIGMLRQNCGVEVLHLKALPLAVALSPW